MPCSIRFLSVHRSSQSFQISDKIFTIQDVFSCKENPEVWMRPKVKPNGDKYWEYVLCYVDDILCISHEPQVVMVYLASKYTLKKGSVKETDAYLGAEVKMWTIDGAENPNKRTCAMSSDFYVNGP